MENGFRCRFSSATVTWIVRNDGLHIHLTFDENKKSWRRKLRSIQYTHPYEDIGQVFHELIVTPTLLFFSDDLVIIHGSALENGKGRAIVIGGTGGVGKTFLEISLIFERDFKFLADDMVFIDKNGYVWPNYAFPKIYAYNVLGDEVAERKVLQDRGFLDVLQWHLKKRISPFRVRRRVNPRIFYDGKISRGSKISDLFILFRGKYDCFSYENISVTEAADISLEIMKNELYVFFKHLLWHKVNRLLMRAEKIIDVNRILSKWKRLYEKILDGCGCYLVKVPLESKPVELKRWFFLFLEDKDS